MLMENMVKVIEQAEIPTQELASILKQGAILRLPYLEGRLLQAREQLKRFEEQYGTTLEALRSQGLPENADYALHEDFNEWEYYQDLLHETERAVDRIKALLDKLEGAGDLH